MKDRRLLSRFLLEVPLRFRLAGAAATVAGKTRDISGSGVFFYADYVVQKKVELEFTVTLPPELTRTIAIQVSCTGTVLRVQNDPTQGRVGVAAIIHSYDFRSD